MKDIDITNPEEVKAEYDRLCEQRDETEVKIAPIRKRLQEAALDTENCRLRAERVRAELDDARGGTAWFALKKRIATLAKLLPRT